VISHVSPNFALLDMSHPEVASLVAAMLQARDAVERRSWAHPQEPTGEEWWADVLADPRARKRERRTDLAVKQAFYRLADERREIILVACSKCDWRAAFAHHTLTHGGTVEVIGEEHRDLEPVGGVAALSSTTTPSLLSLALVSLLSFAIYIVGAVGSAALYTQLRELKGAGGESVAQVFA